MCYNCQEHKAKDGHETKWCPKNICKKCGRKGHTKIGCMFGMEDFPFAKKIVLKKIVSFLNGEDLDRFSKVSKKCSKIGQTEMWQQKLMADIRLNTTLAKSLQLLDITCSLCAQIIKSQPGSQHYYHCNQLQCNETIICDTCFTSQGKYLQHYFQRCKVP